MEEKIYLVYYHVIQTLVQTLFQLILGGMMLGHGFGEDCNNGAADYLITGGYIIVVAHILAFIMAIIICVVICAVSYESYEAEDRIDKTLFCIMLCLSLVSFGVTIWVGKVLHRDF